MSNVNEEDIRASPLIPTKPVYLSFWDKFKELQMKMLSSRVDESIDHRYASAPTDWPFDEKNVAYWLKETGKESSAQIHLVGNIVSWYSALPGFLLFVLIFTGIVLARKRSLTVVREDYLAQMTFVAELLIGGYLLNYLPFFAVESTYFLYHYLPAVLFKLIFVAILVEQIYSVLA
ncbi:protein O-mannosyl-transferase 1-like [Lineus longissimus]|uniref:protein O-mannosyl-transferase 1-like n=2 Tax=Lineus longissimus TaxID=88925 RepID=UPI00315C9E5A